MEIIACGFVSCNYKLFPVPLLSEETVLLFPAETPFMLLVLSAMIRQSTH